MKISIIGSGFVGSTAAYALVMRGIGREIILVDLDKKRAQAEADDLLHAVPFAHSLKISAGDYPDITGSKAVIITAGVGQRPGETRLQLLERNVAVFNEVVPQIYRYAPETIIVVATNPVDVLTHVTAEIAGRLGIPATRVLGSGTTLDTARFRALLGRHLDVDPQHIHAYVVGEHGDSEVLTWSLATVGGMPLEAFSMAHNKPLDDSFLKRIDEQVRRAAYNIIDGKGATYYGIGSALARIIDIILRDQRAILTICSRVDAVGDIKDVTLSLPFLLGGEGIIEQFPLKLSTQEQNQLEKSAEIIDRAVASILPVIDQ